MKKSVTKPAFANTLFYPYPCRTEVVKYLIEKGAEVDYKDSDDMATALEVAAGKGHLEIVQLLVEKGANVNHQDKEGDTPLNEAARGGYVEGGKELMQNDIEKK